jgi:hypothetical protein
MNKPTLAQLRERVCGTATTPADDSYDEARAVYNAMIDRRPAVVVRVEDASDVAAAVDFGRENELPLAIRGGSHSVPGFDTIDDGVAIDLSGMRGVSVNRAKRTARSQGAPPGATSTPPRTSTAWPRRAASSPPPGSRASGPPGGSPAFQIAPPLPFIPEERHGERPQLRATARGQASLRPRQPLPQRSEHQALTGRQSIPGGGLGRVKTDDQGTDPDRRAGPRDAQRVTAGRHGLRGDPERTPIVRRDGDRLPVELQGQQLTPTRRVDVEFDIDGEPG